jgi:phospholipid/cholesterol/gamma-HCH transport system ATP-binding protein
MKPDAFPPSTAAGVRVVVRGLEKSFRGQQVLRGINLEVAPGELLVLMGPSGSGKSVFLRHLIGLETPDSGEVLIDGQPPTEDLRSRRRLAMVFQSGGLLNSLTVGQNVGLYLTEHRLATPDEIQRIVMEKLALVRLSPDSASKLPAELSGGMRRRAAIARALTMDPQLILFDEPTAELDPMVALTIGREIVSLNRRTRATTIVVTHDRDLAFGIAHRIAFLADGRIAAAGTPEEMRGCDLPLLREFLAADFSPEPHPTNDA